MEDLVTIHLSVVFIADDVWPIRGGEESFQKRKKILESKNKELNMKIVQLQSQLEASKEVNDGLTGDIIRKEGMIASLLNGITLIC